MASRARSNLPEEPLFAKLGGWAVSLRGEKQVDTINCLYAFHRDHLTEMQRLARLVGLETRAVANGEDILLSASGTGRPRIHDLGKVLLCLSSHRKGVAVWRTQADFFAERTALFLKLRALKSRD